MWRQRRSNFVEQSSRLNSFDECASFIGLYALFLRLDQLCSGTRISFAFWQVAPSPSLNSTTVLPYRRNDIDVHPVSALGQINRDARATLAHCLS